MILRKILPSLLLLLAFSHGEPAIKNPWVTVFQGNEKFSSYQLEQQLDLPDEFGVIDTARQDFLMKLAQGNIELLYNSQGYFSLQMRLNIQRRNSGTDSAETVYTFNISEGARYTFQDFVIENENPIDSFSINQKRLHFSPGKDYDPTIASDDAQEIRTQYRNKGYLHASVDYMEQLDTVNHLVNVKIYVNSGTKVRMGDFHSETYRPPQFKDSTGKKAAGLSDTTWLNGLWRVKRGDIINGKKYTSFRSKLFSTQMFSQVKMEDSLREDGLSDVHFQAVERIPGDAQYSTFYEEEYGFGVSAEAKHRNFFGHFHEGSLGVLVAQNKQEATLGYANPLLFGTSFTFIPTAIRFDDHLSFNHEKIAPPAYPDSLEERYEVINRGDITFGLSDAVHVRGTLDSRFVQKNDDRLVKIKFETAVTFDYTDDFFNPTKGVRIMPTVGTGANFSGSIKDPQLTGNPYSYGELTLNGYAPLWGPFLGALSGSYGQFFNSTIEDDARMFYQGGSRSVRGYRFRSIYPSYTSVEDGDTIINTGLTPHYLRLNEELRLDIPFRKFKNWQLVQFYDWTHVSDAESGTYKGKTEASLGAGIRYKWQFLTLRIDYAFKKDFDNWSSEPYRFNRFNFDLSQAF